MKTRLLVGLLVLAGSSVGAGPSLEVRVTPTVSAAPATIRISATVTPDANIRAIAIAADSEHFFRSSVMDLDGDKAPRTIQLEYRDLPPGNYEIRAVLIGANRKQLAVAASTALVSGFGVE